VRFKIKIRSEFGKPVLTKTKSREEFVLAYRQSIAGFCEKVSLIRGRIATDRQKEAGKHS
jgi:hypothetical protein